MMSEEKVLKKLDIADFRHLTKDKVIKMASMLDKMDPEVAKKALEQFPEFANTTKEMLTEYKVSLDKGLESNNESVKAVYDTYNAIITSLQKKLENENLTFEQKKYIIEQMKDVAEKVDKKDTENKRFIAGNTDYFLPCGVVIKKEDDKLVIENPGSIRTGKKQMLRGGISDPRNKTLMKMFNMIGIGERAGSGIPDIYQVWENEGWPMPVVEESYNPDRTRLSLEFAKKQTIKTSEEEKEPKRSQKGAEKEPIKGAERKKEILKLIKVNSTITQVEIMKELDLTRKQVQKDMKELQEMHIIAREGTNRRGRWIIVKENR